jgi:hypothetical protein
MEYVIAEFPFHEDKTRGRFTDKQSGELLHARAVLTAH